MNYCENIIIVITIIIIMSHCESYSSVGLLSNAGTFRRDLYFAGSSCRRGACGDH